MAQVILEVGDDTVLVETPTNAVDLSVTQANVQTTVPVVEVAIQTLDPAVSVRVPDQPITVYASQPSVQVDLVGLPGPPGKQGIQGEPGIQGPPGPGGLAAQYVHTQSVLSPSWVVEHNLNKHPEITCEDGAGSVIYGSVLHLDDNTALVGFAVSITGRANCT